MTPLTKDILEVASPVNESTSARANAAPKPAANQLRSDAVSLEIPIRVHGSRITDVVRGVTPHTEPFEEQTTTMIVFAQGGVLKMATAVSPGQMMVLTNLKSRQDVICRVIKVRTNPNMQAYVEIEFTHAQPGYWGVLFPSDNPELAPKLAIAPQPPVPETEIAEKNTPKISAPVQNNAPSFAVHQPEKITPQTPTYVPPPRQESAFISIGSREETQPSASAMGSKVEPSVNVQKKQRAAEPIRKNMASSVTEVPVAPSAPAHLSMPELQGDVSPVSTSFQAGSAARETEQLQESVSNGSIAPSVPSTFGQFGASSAAISSAPSRELFGASLGISGSSTLTEEERPRKNWLLIAACAAGAVLALGGWGLYFHRATASDTQTRQVPAINEAPAPSMIQNSASQASQPSGTAENNTVRPASTSASESNNTARQDVARSSKAVVTDHVDSPTPAQTGPNGKTKILAGTLNAHPVAQQRSDANQTEAPTLDAKMVSGSEAASLPGIPGSSGGMSLPTIAKPDSPRIGGQLSGPKLISSIAPVYPTAARQTGIEGDVVIHAVIDQNGNVSETQVISGPSVLRQAALTAIHQWKYSPSTLNGETVSSETTVTLRFHR